MNYIIHGYFGIDVDKVWSVVTKNLNILERDLHKSIKNNIDISKALFYEIEEYKNLNDVKIVKYLMELTTSE